MEFSNLSEEQRELLDTTIQLAEDGELMQAEELAALCNNKYQYAKTHSNYVKDWEKVRSQFWEQYSLGNYVPGLNKEMMHAFLTEYDEIMKKKLSIVQGTFEKKFGESIFNFLGPDGKAKKIFGIF